MTLPDEHSDVTLLINAVAHADVADVEQLLPLDFEQLWRAAQQRMATELNGRTRSAKALSSEAYLKLVGPRKIDCAGCGHCCAAATQATRRILIDDARSRGVRGGSRRPATLFGRSERGTSRRSTRDTAAHRRSRVDLHASGIVSRALGAEYEGPR